MQKVTCIIWSICLLVLINSCGKGEKLPEYKLPESIEHAKPGKVGNITPKAFIDSLKFGVKMDIYYLDDINPETAQSVVDIPGMIHLQLSEMFFISETLSVEEPIYLICLYGDDSKRMAEKLRYDGISSYYLDGGSYRLWQEMQKNDWKLPGTTNSRMQKR